MPIKLSSRDRILDAAAELMSTAGLARTTTKEIARAAGLSEAMLYKHFRSKEELFLAVLGERVPGFLSLLRRLPEHVGRDTVPANLAVIASTVIGFYRDTLPMAASLFADPQLMTGLRAHLAETGRGPQLANVAVVRYLRAEQEQGRVSPEADCDAAAHLLLGGCLYWAYLTKFTDRLPFASQEECVSAIVATVRPVLGRPED